MADHEQLTRMRWWGWGTDGHDRPLPKAAESLLRDELGVGDQRVEPVEIGSIVLPASRLTEAAREALGAAVGADHVVESDEARIAHAAGRSYTDLVGLRSGRLEHPPDAVVSPDSHDEVVAALAVCDRLGIAVVPFGGGTSVVGGVEPLRGRFDSVISLDLRRLDRILELDPRSQLARVEAGMLGPDLERELGRRGMTLGHFPQSFEFSTVGGWTATRSAGQASTGYGRIDELVVSLRVAAPAGVIEPRAVPATAAGPDLRELLVGSEGTLGVITEVSLRVRPKAAVRHYEAWTFKTFEAGADALRELEQSGRAPDVARLSDSEETRLTLTMSGGGAAVSALQRYLAARGHREGCMLIAGFEDSADGVRARRRGAAPILRERGALRLGTAPGKKWAEGRFHGPYMRDELMSRGVFVETLETATSWTALRELHGAVREALLTALAAQGTPGRVMCHLSHLYPTGASLYFTFLARALAGHDLEQWDAAKTAACEAILAGGGTITHHHAIGRDHARWLPAEVGDLGIEALRSTKLVLDPRGIMNPGKLADRS